MTLYLHESLGARQLCAVLRERGHRCSLIFLKEFRWGEFRVVTPQEERLLRELLRSLKPDLVGISLTSSLTADLGLSVADLIRRELGVPVIVGGAHASACPDQCIEHADYVCRGEGEEALAELCDALAEGRPTTGIANLWVREDGRVWRNDVRPLADNLDSLPFPTFNEPGCYFIEADMLQELDPATHIALYHTYAARMACPFTCTFCAGVWLRRELYAGKGPVRRYRSVDHLLRELKQVIPRHPNLRMVQFWDEIFGVRAPEGWLEEFCDRYPREIGLPFGIWSDPRLVTDEFVGRLKAAGLKSAVMGIESGSERVRREVLNRRERNSVVLRAARILRRHEVEVGYDFILDLPWMAEENCRGTFEMVMQLPQPFRLGLHSLSFLPQTEVTRRALAEGIIRPEQVASADRPLPERFESFLWKYRIGATDRRAAFWHSLIFLASAPFVPRRLLWTAYRLRWLLRRFPGPFVVAAEAARSKLETGEARLFEAFAAVYPRLAAVVARRPWLARFLNRLVRLLARPWRRRRGGGGV